MKKSWIDKTDCQKSFKIKTTTKKFADILEGSNMLIASPPVINDYVKSSPHGKLVEPSTMRFDLETIALFWRIVKLISKLAGKLACGVEFIAKRQTEEKIIVL